MKLNLKTNFPWLLSNLEMLDGSRLAGTEKFRILEKGGFKFGIIGLAELGWITTLNGLDMDELSYEDYVTCGTKLAKELREVYQCDFVIALTHMRVVNDERFGREVEGVDFILGGHDHVPQAY